MSFKEMQKQVDEWTSQFKPQYWTPHQIALHMQEELGEIGRILNRVYGPKPPKKAENITDLNAELGDLLFAIVCMANKEGIDLNEAWEKIMSEKTKRDDTRFEKKD